MRIIYLFGIVIIFWVYFDTHYFDKRYDFENFDAQGLECLEGKSGGLYIIAGKDGGELYSFDKGMRVASFKRPEQNTQKSISFLSHPTSLVLRKDGSGVVVNSMLRLPPKIVVYEFDMHLSDGYLTRDSIISITEENDFKGLRVELVDFKEKPYLVLVGDQGNGSTMRFVNGDTLNQICDIDIGGHVQNIFWNKKNQSLVLSKNIISSTGSLIQEIKFSDTDLLEGNICPIYKRVKTTFFITPHELEAYAQCNNKEYFLYNNGTNGILYER
mgnify:FL=1